MQEELQGESKKKTKGINYAALGFLVFIGGVIAVSNIANRSSDSNSKTVTSSESIEESTGDLPSDLDYSEIEDLYDLFRKNYNGPISEDQLIDGLKKGLIEGAGDKYSVYLTKEESEEFNKSLEGEFSGIGAELGVEGDSIIIVAPLDDHPAQKAGLQPKDAIVAIDGGSAAGIAIETAIARITGEAGTDVVLTIERDGETFDVTITREKITIPSVEFEVKENLGYVRITRFASDTASLTEKAVKDLVNQNVEGLIIDLRRNGGGFLQSSIDVASNWVDGELVVSQSESGSETKDYKARRGQIVPDDLKTIVLIDQGSASASEILAGALSELDEAILLGSTSFGKGTVQQLIPADGGATLKVTTARWFTPDGNTIDGEGIKPDIEFVDPTPEDETDEVLDAAIKELK